MLALYRIEEGQVVPAEEGNAQIYIYSNLKTQDDYAPLAQNFEINPHLIRSALDAEEIARIATTDEFSAVIFKRPHNSQTSEGSDMEARFRITSLGLFLFPDVLVGVYDEEIAPEDFVEIKQPVHNIQDVMLNLIYHATFHFFEEFRNIQKQVQQIEQTLFNSTTNKQLMELFALEKSMIHYLNSLGGNNALLERLVHSESVFRFNKKQLAFLKDMMIDSNQCFKQAEIASEIMASLTDTSASLVNNKLSLLMKRLTVISLIFLPINAIAGIGGMSEFTTAAEKLGFSMGTAYVFLSLGMLGVAYLTWYLIHKISS